MTTNRVDFCTSIFSSSDRFPKDIMAFKILEQERSLPSCNQDMETGSF
ncbi:MAG: hypothetical protein MGG37_01770 [Trichodesmium sp. MAG_R01]|nr:hypothetical protein [Trichodesmium sp. MAG_R01]